jgi:transcriptional regulator with XRE-family HTH domain
MGWKGAPRLAALLADQNKRQLAKALNMDPSTLSNYTSGRRSPDPDTLARICEAIGTTPDALLGFPEKFIEAPSRKGDSIGFVEKVGKVAAGAPRFDVFDRQGKRRTYYFREEFMKHLGYDERDPERFLPVGVSGHVDGDSMIPTIRPHALLLVDRGPKPEPRGVRTLRDVKNGAIYLCFVDGGLTVKRVYKSERMLMLWPDNQAVQPIPVPLDDDIDLARLLVGKVVWVGQELE